METKRAVELLIKEVDKIPQLKTLPSSNDEFRLWLKNVENIINTGLEREDKQKFREASQFLRYIRMPNEDDLIQQDYIDEIIRYEIALKSIIQRYEILGIKGERDKGGEVGMDKRKALELLKQALIKIPKLRKLHYNNQDFKLWQARVGTIIKEGLDEGDYNTFESVQSLYFLDDIVDIGIEQSEDYPKKLKDYETALKSIIEKYEILGIEEKPSTIEVAPELILSELPPKAFISHGKGEGALLKLERFLRELGVSPIIVKDKPNLDRTVDDKVADYLNEADFVIIFATGDDIIKDKEKEIRQPRQNVIHEIGLAQKTHPGKIIYLLEERAEFPSNIRPKVYESFARQSMDNVFTAIVREMRSWGFLKVGK